MHCAAARSDLDTLSLFPAKPLPSGHHQTAGGHIHLHLRKMFKECSALCLAHET